ncbi:MAG: GNAT family N-acetyltransferase [Haloferacaceae archaeon]
MSRRRPARPTDRPALRRLQSHLPEPAPALLDHGIRTGGVLVSVAGERPVGYLLAVGASFDPAGSAAATGTPDPLETPGLARPPETDVPPEPSDARVTGGRRPDGAHLAELVVAPDHRREGRASELLDGLIAATDGPVTVAVAPENEAALSLYRGRGFERVERREDYFASGPALWLVRR